ncbi:hypothetical protein KA005_41320 [bacterium]|nr:hypothetical protein [bacterium]
MPNGKLSDKQQFSLWLSYDFANLVDHEAGKMDLSRTQFCTLALQEYIARIHSKPVCQTLSQKQYSKAK